MILDYPIYILKLFLKINELIFNKFRYCLLNYYNFTEFSAMNQNLFYWSYNIVFQHYRL